MRTCLGDEFNVLQQLGGAWFTGFILRPVGLHKATSGRTVNVERYSMKKFLLVF